MPRWIHQQTGAGQRDFPNLMKLETTIMSGQSLNPSTMDDWSSTATASWAPINCNVDTLLRILLQNHPLGSLSEFRKNSTISYNNAPLMVLHLPHTSSTRETPKAKAKAGRLAIYPPSHCSADTRDPDTLRTRLPVPGPQEPPRANGHFSETKTAE